MSTIATASSSKNTNNHNPSSHMDYEPGKVISCESEEEYHEIIRLASSSTANNNNNDDGAAVDPSSCPQGRLIVFDCYADWCPPCRQMSPIFAGMAKEYPHIIFVKVNVDVHPEIGQLLGGIWAMPTFVFVQGNKRVGSFMGANERLLKRGLEQNGNVSMCSTVSCQIQ
mmetsp:Transcript_10524/g.14920  ORF Transcript_10524/g.14920 Transcript_10524/m.14920 type:complete len:169 (-) Transcript_10524:72-578(-)